MLNVALLLKLLSFDNSFIDILCGMVFFHLRILKFLMGISLIVILFFWFCDNSFLLFKSLFMLQLFPGFTTCLLDKEFREFRSVDFFSRLWASWSLHLFLQDLLEFISLHGLLSQKEIHFCFSFCMKGRWCI